MYSLMRGKRQEISAGKAGVNAGGAMVALHLDIRAAGGGTPALLYQAKIAGGAGDGGAEGTAYDRAGNVCPGAGGIVRRLQSKAAAGPVECHRPVGGGQIQDRRKVVSFQQGERGAEGNVRADRAIVMHFH